MPRDPLDLMPDKMLRIPLYYVVSGIFCLVSLGVGYGGYRAGFYNQAETITKQQEQITTLNAKLTELTYQVGRLTQSLDDFKNSLNYDRDRSR